MKERALSGRIHVGGMTLDAIRVSRMDLRTVLLSMVVFRASMC